MKKTNLHRRLILIIKLVDDCFLQGAKQKNNLKSSKNVETYILISKFEF